MQPLSPPTMNTLQTNACVYIFCINKLTTKNQINQTFTYTRCYELQMRKLSLVKEKIPAVADKDLRRLLKGLGLLENLEKHSILCSICEKTLSLKNIGCLYPSESEIKLCCDNLKCLQKAIGEITPLREMYTKGGNKDES